MGDGGLNALSLGLIYGQVGLLGIMAFATFLFRVYRDNAFKKLKRSGQKFGAPLIFHSPDGVPREFQQCGYCSSIVGNIVIYSWVVLPLAGYVVMIWGVWISYTIADGLYFPPSVKFWKDTFGDWNGLMMPWCLWFTIVHLVAAVVSKFIGAIQAGSMLPVASMKNATHLIIDEDLPMDPDACYDPDEVDEVWLVKKFRTTKQRVKKTQTRQVVPIKHDEHGNRYVEYTCVRYVYYDSDEAFLPQGLRDFQPLDCHECLQKGGLSDEEAEVALAICGPNSIHVHVPGIIEALATEFADFTYVFNSIGTWAYMAYSTWNIGFIWLAMILGSGIYRALFIIRPNQKKIAEMAAMHEKCEVLRGGRWLELEASQVALGDIVKIQDGDKAKLPCDGLLVDGGLIVNESMLTGEPMPVAKAPVPKSRDAAITDKLNKAYAGTLALESTGQWGKSLMLATNIGALTTRGQLIRMVLFPASVKFKYNDQLPVVYGIMSVYAAILVFVLLFATDLGSAVATYLAVLCTVAMTLNPMLPVSMVMGQSVSAGRLEDPNGPYQIKCLQPGRIPIAGKISTMVFDKTGTITKGGMDFASVISVVSGAFLSRVDFDHSVPECQANRDKVMDQQLVPTFLCRALVSCHTVKKLKTGSLVGNQVECAMVRTCGWSLGHRQIISPRGEILTVVRELEFDHHRMTSGAVVRDETGKVQVFIKGSYEKVREIALPQSVPSNYDHVTQKCAKENFYTLGISTKELPSQMTDQQLADLPRQQLEDGVSVCGLLLFRNEMKADSPLAMEMLKKGSIRSVICTGDNELTGIAIGRQCGIVTSGLCLKGNIEGGRLVWTDPDNESLGYVTPESPDPKCQLAVTCSAWRFLHLQDHVYLQTIWPRLVVFARMKPDDKINVVRYLQSRGLVVGMAGDGGNDCGGLRAAHAGIALSDAEASMVSPFSTGRVGEGAANQDISLTTVPDLIREGRACLATNLATFQYFMVYAFTLTTIRTSFLVMAALSFGEWVWVTMDLGIGVLMMFFMTQSKAQPELTRFRPTATLLGARTISAILFPYFSGLILLVVSITLLRVQPWYDPLNPTFDIHVLPRLWMMKGDNYDSSVGALSLFAVLSTTAYVNTYGGDFRRNICRNFGMNIVYALFSFGLLFITITEPNRFACIYRINCDTRSSLACKSIPVLSQWSVGGTGGCFLGPQLKYWQNSTMSYWTPLDASEPWWLPSPDHSCLPPQRTLDEIPEKSTVISTGKGFKVVDGCIGPNNCLAPDFKYMMAGLLCVFVLCNHAFTKIVLLGPVTRRFRSSRQREMDAIILDESTEDSSASSSEEAGSDDSLICL